MEDIGTTLPAVAEAGVVDGIQGVEVILVDSVVVEILVAVVQVEIGNRMIVR
jgi:hypothetical protein